MLLRYIHTIVWRLRHQKLKLTICLPEPINDSKTCNYSIGDPCQSRHF